MTFFAMVLKLLYEWYFLTFKRSDRVKLRYQIRKSSVTVRSGSCVASWRTSGARSGRRRRKRPPHHTRYDFILRD
jgi:hypothetical protein